MNLNTPKISILIKNGGYHGLSTLVDRGTFFLIFIVIGRYFGETELGKLSTVLNLANVLQTISDFGLSVLIQRESSRNPDATLILRDSFIVKIFSAILLYPVVYLYALQIPEISIYYFTGIYASVALFGFTGLFFQYFAGVGRNKEYFVFQFIPRILILLLFSLMIFLGNENLILAVFFIPAMLQLILVLTSKIDRNNWFIERIEIREFTKRLKRSYPIWLGLIFVMGYDKIDVLIISKYLGLKEAGIYFSSYTLIKSVIVFTSFYLVYYFSQLSKTYVSDKTEFKSNVKTSLKISLSLGISLVLFFNLFAESLLSLLYGEGFAQYSDVLQLLSIAVIFIILNYNLGTILNAMDQSKIPMYGGGIAFTFNLIANLIFVPLYGYMAAVYITVLTELTMTTFLFIKLSARWRNLR
ncbi:MAG: flippase [Melioribacteraceae bacterium]|nr:flippase [Melioribacteraceae bacterium]MCF8431168.1 flippase [Melioribacteraceae bacterium]